MTVQTIENRELMDFFEVVTGQVEDTATDEDEKSSSRLVWDTRLAEVVLDYMEESGYANEPVIAPHEDAGGRNLCRIIGYSLRDDGQTLDLFTAAYLRVEVEAGIPPLPREDVSRLTGRAVRFFDHVAKGNLDRFAGNPVVLEAAEAIHAGLDQITQVRVHLLTNGIVKDRAIQSIEVAGRPVEFSVMDIERLYRTAGRPTSRADIEIDFVKLMGRPLPTLEVQPKPPEYETYLAIFPGDLLYQLYDTYGPRLLEFNVRSFLQAKGNVNKGIRDTLRSEPERFLAYNNGLTATVDQIEVGSFHGQTCITRISGLQIVNGGQTTASVHRAKKLDKIDVSRVAVAVKLTRVREDRLQEFVPLISRYSNTQNVIQVSDLSANHPFHIAIERLSESVWCPGEQQRWFYERARGGYQVALNRFGTTPAKRRNFRLITPPDKKITKTDAAKYLMAWLGRPHDVSRGAQKNFAIFMAELEALFPAGWEPDETFYRALIAKGIIYRAAERIVRQEAFPAYRANIVAYLVAYLAFRVGHALDLEEVWNSQAISELLMTLLREWSHDINSAITESAAGRNVTEWCKKEGCWNEVRDLNLLLPEEPLPEMGGGADGSGGAISHGPSSAVLRDQTERCMGLGAEAWARIAAWGRESGRLRDIEWKVAKTMADYAMEGWPKTPSPKQLRHALRAIDFAIKDGLLAEVSNLDADPQ